MATIDKQLWSEVERVREQCKSADDARDAGLPTDIPEVKRINKISYGPDEEQTLDISRPTGMDGDLPTIINVHGGGWVYGTTEVYQFYCLALAKAGFNVVSFNYRLPPKVQFPGELDDLHRVMHWVCDHSSEYHLDLNNVFLVGDSAGGQMVEQYVTILANPSFRALFTYDVPKLSVRAAALNCSACFMKEELAYTSKKKIAGAITAYFTPEAVEAHQRQLDTETYMTSDIVPLFLLTANDDFLRDHMYKLDGFLIAKGIDHRIECFGDKDNPRSHVFHINQRDPLATEANEMELDFFRSHLA
ncbi:lipase [Coriobacterium glomerans PW2]|uniref:Lipase n=1 Tax=Coriobacterium glomerans (strain ATCC 49209 / DSM 20642 / JCM 10262 / PW2) TaxID=700015 RepID=F2N8W7_CORGP|nr:alpha/beta hydrolase [Coriobacterium glomerans]AEB07567.1 lipase [Coriobacterium glomerans PW2]